MGERDLNVTVNITSSDRLFGGEIHGIRSESFPGTVVMVIYHFLCLVTYFVSFFC
jgi:hypothetical protein